MSRPTLAAVCLFALPAYVIGQAGDVTAVEQQDPQAAYAKLAKDWNEAYSAWQEKAMEARKARKAMPPPPTKEFIERAQAQALEYAGEDGAVPFHGFVLKWAYREKEAVKKTLLTLTMDHSESAAIGDLLEASYFGTALRMGAKGEAMELFAEVIEFNESNELKAKALLARGTLRLENEEQDAGVKDLEKIATLTKDKDLIAAADDALFEIRHLQIGCEAPDILGKDIDGVEFKLSDYRGKVILLDFWGFW